MDFDILNPIKLYKKKKLNWFELWTVKSDYINNYYNNIKGLYSIIDESIDYYMAMLEMGIFYLKNYSNYFDYLYIQHNIILDNEMSIKEDIKERDFAEYLKYLFYENYDIKYVDKLIEEGRNFNYNLVLARLLYPSYYLFYLDRVIIDKKDLDELKNIVDKHIEYEKYIKYIVDEMNKYLVKKIILPF